MPLVALPGAGAWLIAPPAQGGREMDATLFRVAFNGASDVPRVEEDSFCPCCGQCSDRCGDHAFVCACSGDHTVRHNAMCKIYYEEAELSGARPERKKAGLLPSRPREDGLPATNLFFLTSRPRAARPTSGSHGACKVTPGHCFCLLQRGSSRPRPPSRR